MTKITLLLEEQATNGVWQSQCDVTGLFETNQASAVFRFALDGLRDSLTLQKEKYPQGISPAALASDNEPKDNI